jgi:Zn-dependent peptidase ImmA (M78 family)
MPRPKRSTAEQEAEKLLDELRIDEIPVPVEAVLRRLGVRVVHERMGSDVSGMTYRRGQQFIVGLNSGHNLRRQRFTAAHEIGHIRLHPGRPLTIDSSIRVNFRDQVSSQATNAEEIEANAFAAALLMPREAVVDHARHLTEEQGLRSREKLIAELARLFDVSPEAMGYRLINLGVTSAP